MLDFCRAEIYALIMPDKKGVKIMSAKIGRPSDNPRLNKISVRISNEDKEILETYCLKENVNKTEAISRGIKKLKDGKK